MLLKMIGQSSSNLWIDLFLLLNEVSSGILKKMNEFWWENGMDNKGI